MLIAKLQFLSVLFSLVRSVDHHSPMTLTSIAFGSCSKQTEPQPFWDIVHEHWRPDLWLWLGDNVYADQVKFGIPNWRVPATPEQIASAYAVQLNHPGYRKLLNDTPVLGIWDDHDYGENDGGATYVHREASQQLFLDFLSEPALSPRRSREGTYSSQLFGFPPQQVLFLLLDVRYFKDLSRGQLLGYLHFNFIRHLISALD
jgi:alkaline phosphatase D